MRQPGGLARGVMQGDQNATNAEGQGVGLGNTPEPILRPSAYCLLLTAYFSLLTAHCSVRCDLYGWNFTFTGRALLARVPSPSWPYWLLPQQ
jgi:hypothetical protein